VVDGLVQAIDEKNTELIQKLAREVKSDIEEITCAVGKLAERSERLKAAETGDGRKET
jgi:hypothetical protein